MESRVAFYQVQVLLYNFQNMWVFCPCLSTASITIAECDTCLCSSMLASPIHAYETRGDVAIFLDCPQLKRTTPQNLYQKICMVNIPPTRAPMELEEILEEIDFCIMLISATHQRGYLLKKPNYLAINSRRFLTIKSSLILKIAKKEKCFQQPGLFKMSCLYIYPHGEPLQARGSFPLPHLQTAFSSPT